MKTNNLDSQLTDRVELLEQRLTQSEQRFRVAERRYRVLGVTAFGVVLGAMLLVPGNRAAIAQGYGVTLQSLEAQIVAAQANITTLQNKTQFMTASTAGQSTTFTACNVYVQNGLGATNGNPASPIGPGSGSTNGLGNLIIGYNASVGFARTGSHNLVLGDANGYTSFGGIVAGTGNQIDGQYATITGGTGGVASGALSTICGGFSNSATGLESSCFGGNSNLASGQLSTTGGGSAVTESNSGGWAAGSFHSP